MKHGFIRRKHILKILSYAILIALSMMTMTACSSDNSRKGYKENSEVVKDYTNTEESTRDSLTDYASIEESERKYNGELQAAELTHRCKDIYAGVVVGSINNNDSNVIWAADKDSLQSNRNAAANSITVKQVLSCYSDSENIEAEIISGNYYYCTSESLHSSYISVGDIKFSDTGSEPMDYGWDVTFNELSLNTTLGKLFGKL